MQRNENMKRVLEFITSMGEGGAQSLVKDYALNINKNEFDVTVFCVFPMLNSGPGQLLRLNGVKLISVYPSYNKFYAVVNKFFGSGIVKRKLRRCINNIKPDVVHAHLKVANFLKDVRNILPPVVLYTCHSEPLRNFGKVGTPEFNAVKTLISTNNLRLIALHEKMRQELNEMFSVDNTVVVYNGININRFRNVHESKENIRCSESIANDAFVIGHVGRFTYAKNHEFLVDIFKIVHQRNPKSVLLLIGTGELKEKVFAKVKYLNLNDSVRFLSQRTDVERLLKAMDVFLFPSHYEGLPVSLIEAQAAGIRVVTSDNVTEEAFLTPKLIVKSLACNAEEWADAVLDNTAISKYNRPLSIFEMKEDIKILESLYMGRS